ncbi:MAG TPA: hypothetical protein VEK07_15325 [Polyangiaceae bacterium]|nr:hypothetical protein [Polyangiaceae bacterium]
MSELSPEASALLRAGRTAFRPGAPDRDRVFQSLQGVLSTRAVVDGGRDASGVTIGGASRVGLQSWVAGGIALVALGTGAAVAAHFWTRTSLHVQPAPRSPAAAIMEAMPSASQSPPEIADAPKPVRAGEGRTAPRTAGRSVARPTSDFLQEEVRLLSRAEQQMNDGLLPDALKTLEEHERRFPTGALTEERMAARVQALCALGRPGDAKGELSRLARAYPGSPHLQSARRVCGIDVGSTP